MFLNALQTCGPYVTACAARCAVVPEAVSRLEPAMMAAMDVLHGTRLAGGLFLGGRPLPVPWTTNPARLLPVSPVQRSPRRDDRPLDLALAASGLSRGERRALLDCVARHASRNVAADQADEFVRQAFAGLRMALISLARHGFHPKRISCLLAAMAEASGHACRYAYDALPLFLAGSRRAGWGSGRQGLFLSALMEGVGDSLGVVLNFAGRALVHTEPDRSARTAELILTLRDHVAEFHCGTVFTLLVQHAPVLPLVGPSQLNSHLELYVALLRRWPPSAVRLLEGILEATASETIPADLSGLFPASNSEGLTEWQAILRFIERTSGFIPALYAAYRQEGEGLFSRLRRHRHAMLCDELGPGTAGFVDDGRELDCWLGVIQMVSPIPWSSHNLESRRGHLAKVWEGDDHRDDVPPEWRGRVERFAIPEFGWRLKAGESPDPDGVVRAELNHLRLLARGPDVSERMAGEALVRYLQSDRTAHARTRFRKILFKAVCQEGGWRTRLDRLRMSDYEALALLRRFAQAARGYLASLVNRVPEPQRRDRGGPLRRVVNPEGLAVQLNQVWQGNASRDERKRILGSILARYDSHELEKRLLNRRELGDGVRTAAREARGQAPLLTKRQIIRELAEEGTAAVAAEWDRYEYALVRELPVGVRPVKGPAYGLWGYTARVCTRFDLALWRNPGFVPLAVIDEAQGKVLGYVQSFSTTVEKKKILTLPGIQLPDPFLKRVGVDLLYGALIDAVVALADAAGHEAVYIPTDFRIQSEQMAIRLRIEAAGYPVRKIPTLHWTTLDQYGFSEVFAVWERGEMKDL